jgi:hypothetical protein
MFDPTPDEIRAYWQGEGANVDRRGPCPNPNHTDADGPNFQVNPTSGYATCYSKCDKTWSMLEWEMEVHGGTVAEAWNALFRKIGRTPTVPTWSFPFDLPKRVPPLSVQFLVDHINQAEARHKAPSTKLYQYSGTDSKGVSGRVCVKVRFQNDKEKTFQWWALTDKGGWTSPKKLDIAVDLYRSPEWKNQTEVHLLNGEKAVDRAVSQWGLATATCLPNGEDKWRHEYLAAFAEVKRVFIVPDNDTIGRKHAHLVGHRLAAAGIEVRIVALPGLPPKGDLYDYIEGGGTLGEYLNIARDSPRRPRFACIHCHSRESRIRTEYWISWWYGRDGIGGGWNRFRLPARRQFDLFRPARWRRLRLRLRPTGNPGLQFR